MLLTILPPAAFGRDPAVDQYVESVPRAGGDRFAGTEPRSAGGGLPSGVRQRLREEGGQDARALRAVGSSAALGAPEARRRGGDGRDSRDAAVAGSPSAIDAVASAAGGDGDAGRWLLAGLALLSAALAAVALARRRSLG